MWKRRKRALGKHGQDAHQLSVGKRTGGRKRGKIRIEGMRTSSVGTTKSSEDRQFSKTLPSVREGSVGYRSRLDGLI